MEERVRGGEDLRLIDHVHTEGLQGPGLGRVTDAALRHHGDRDGVHDPLYLHGIRHPGHTPRRTDVRGDALESHHGDGTRLLRDAGLLRVRDVHDHAALLHLREATLEELGTMAELTQVQIEGHESSPASYGT